MKKYDKSIFIFSRSFRLHDNIGLLEALKNSSTVIPIFIFTPEQINKNPYKSNNAIQFMIESLDELDQELKDKGSRLFYFFGKQHLTIDKLINELNVDAVFINMDYTPYAKERDTSIRNICKKSGIDFIVREDYLLQPVGSIKTGNDTVYQKYTPYYNIAKNKKVLEPQHNKYRNYYKTNEKIKGEYNQNIHNFYEKNKEIVINGGRSNALKILRDLNNFKQYDSERNTLNIPTTRLSAYIKFGCVSIREVYHRFKKLRNDLVKQLIWRDFYYNITFAYPHTINDNINRNFKKNYQKVKWITMETASKKDMDNWIAWKKGKTGFPVVDACMREMNRTGYMHNRGRLIVAVFLTKILMWHWKYGEKYFAKQLVDYDPSVNNGNWQWCSSSGVDSQPYFRIFNPQAQGKKHDPDAEYIKQWIPELKNVVAKDIHKWEESYKNYDIDYPKPIIDYSNARDIAIKEFKKAY